MKKILLIFLALFCFIGLMAQNSCECYSRLMDSVKLNNSNNIYLFANSSLDSKGIFDGLIEIREKDRLNKEVDSFMAISISYQETFKCFDSAIKRINYEQFREIRHPLDFSKKEFRLLRKKFRLINRSIPLIEFENKEKRIKSIYKRLEGDDIKVLDDKYFDQMPALVIPYQRVLVDDVEIIALELIKNGFRITYYCLDRIE